MILETTRLHMRPLAMEDAPLLISIYSKQSVMTFSGGVASSEKILERLHNYIRSFERDGYGVMAVILKDSQQFIGVMGYVPQTFEGKKEIEIVYLLDKAHWAKDMPLRE